MDTLQKFFAYFTGVHARGHYFWGTGLQRPGRAGNRKAGWQAGDRTFIAPHGPAF
ncbi:hypothetical protein [Burkholderia cepacia]|uniref:hypothetical protein n=1 Tax=Burkholderia cepacia TaxID=292 RepID=UPI0014196DB0|nr:hypothetical protein [Burkholderia cepacia]